MVDLDGRSLTVADVEAVARHAVRVRVSPGAINRLLSSTRVLARRTPIVEARFVVHSAPVLDLDEVRAVVVVRANQLLTGGAGATRVVVDRLVNALNVSERPQLGGSLSAGTPLAEVMAAFGEQWATSDRSAASAGGAAAVAVAALAAADLDRVLDAQAHSAAIAASVLGASVEGWSDTAVLARPHRGQIRAARRLQVNLPERYAPTSVVDAPCIRAVPQVLGAAMSASVSLDAAIDVELNSSPEDLLCTEDRAWRTGNGDDTMVLLAIDHMVLAVLRLAEQTAARVTMVAERARAGGPVAEPYRSACTRAAAALVSQLRPLAVPASLSQSADNDDQRVVAFHAARRSRVAVGLLAQLVALELVLAGACGAPAAQVTLAGADLDDPARALDDALAAVQAWSPAA